MGSGELQSIKKEPTFRVLDNQWRQLLEVCHYTEDLNPAWQTKILQEELKELSPPLQPIKSLEQDFERYQAATAYFFETLNFQILDDSDISLQNCFLPSVMKSRQGPASIIMLLLVCLLEECGINTQVSSCRDQYLLKVQLDEKTNILDLNNPQKFLKPHEIVELINQGFDFSNGALDSNCIVIEYLNLIKELSHNNKKLHLLSMTHSYLMKYQPFNLKHLSERAIVAYETGDYKRALEDIRSYFQYKQSHFTNQQLKKIYRKALRIEKGFGSL